MWSTVFTGYEYVIALFSTCTSPLIPPILPPPSLYYPFKINGTQRADHRYPKTPFLNAIFQHLFFRSSGRNPRDHLQTQCVIPTGQGLNVLCCGLIFTHKTGEEPIIWRKTIMIHRVTCHTYQVNRTLVNCSIKCSGFSRLRLYLSQIVSHCNWSSRECMKNLDTV